MLAIYKCYILNILVNNTNISVTKRYSDTICKSCIQENISEFFREVCGLSLLFRNYVGVDFSV